jgi:hypothetical protein
MGQLMQDSLHALYKYAVTRTHFSNAGDPLAVAEAIGRVH